MPEMSNTGRSSSRSLALATAMIVCASYLAACTPTSTNGSKTPETNQPYAVALEEQREQIIITHDRESPEERVKNRTVVDSIKRMRASYKLLPDRRFLLAITEIDHLISGESKAEVRLSHKESEWTITYKDQTVGKVKDFASGPELFALLNDWARIQKNKLGPEIVDEPGKIAAPVDSVSTTQLCQLISNADGKHIQKDIGVVQTAATAAAWLSSISVDDTGVADQFLSHALALNACSSGAEHIESIRNECLLADAMHYFEHARLRSLKLDASDPVRLYIQQNVATLDKMCQANRKSQTTNFLYLMALAKNRDSSRWLKTVRELGSETQKMAVAIVRSACEFGGKTQLPVGHYLMVATSRELGNGKIDKPINFEDLVWSYEKSRESSEWTVGGMGKDFERTLQESTTTASPILKDFYLALFASGAYRMAKSYLSLHADANRVNTFAKSLSVDAGPLSNLRPWLVDILKADRTGSAQENTVNEIERLPGLGTRPLADIVLQNGTFSKVTNPYRLIPPGRKLFQLADTRPDTRLRLAEVADKTLLYPSLSHALHLSVLRDGTSSSFGSKIERAIALRHQDEMLSLLRTSVLSADEELRILQRLQSLGSLSLPAITMLYKQSCQRHAMAWEFVEPCCTFLIHTNQSASARHMLESFTKIQQKIGTEEAIRAKAILASMALSDKRYSDGLKNLTELENTEQATVLILKARLLEGLGKKDDAETWAKEALKRFPKDPNCITLNAELLWKNGKNAQAAELLSTYRQLLSETEWRDVIAPAFAKIFSSNSNALVPAVGSLIDLNLNGPDTLGQLARAVYVADRPAEAFEILTKVNQQNVDAGDLYTCAYRYLKRWKGEKYALSWLSTGVQQRDRIKLAPYAFVSGQFELLWTFIPDTTTDEETNRLWLMRAAACLVDKALYAKYKAPLIAHFKNVTGTDAELGQYLLSIKKSFPQAELNERNTCISSFYLGWKLLATGENFFDGTELYHLALETEQPSLSEFRWSQIWLIDLMTMLENNPAVMESARYHKLQIVGPVKDGQFEKQRRFGISAF